MNAVASIDGDIQELAAAAVPVVDRGFLYGDAVFEALRTYGRRPDALEQHLTRLARSCEIVGIALDVALSQLADDVLRAIDAVPGSECYIRIIVTRGDFPESIGPQGAARPRRIVLVRPLPSIQPAIYSAGIRAVTCPAPPSPLWAGAKPTAYLANLLAVGEAQRRGADDAILLGSHGELLEGATSSLFLVSAGEIFTPPLSLGILPGITRDRVMQSARRIGLAVRERLLTVRDAYRADELFLTSSVRQVVAVINLDGKPIGAGGVGPIMTRVAAAYQEELPQTEPA